MLIDEAYYGFVKKHLSIVKKYKYFYCEILPKAWGLAGLR